MTQTTPSHSQAVEAAADTQWRIARDAFLGTDDKIESIQDAWRRVYERVAESVRAELTSQQEVAAPVGEFDDWPDFNEQAMGCGLEDRNITDRYEAMRYGWDEAMERVGERFEQFLAASRVPVVQGEVVDLEWQRLPEIRGKFLDYAKEPTDANALRIIRACADRFTPANMAVGAVGSGAGGNVLAPGPTDAERYQWLNANHDMLLRLTNNGGRTDTVLLRCGDPLDKWIDAAIASQRATASPAGEGEVKK